MFATSVIDDGLLRISLDDGKANAMDEAKIDAINEALDEAVDAKAVVLTGRPGKFSGGFDLNAFSGGEPDAVRTLVEKGGRLVHRLYGFPKPLVAAVTGHAVALGALLVLACDVRIGVNGPFKIGLNEVAIGLPLPAFGLELARARLPARQLEPSVVHATLYDPETALKVGFLDEVTSPEDLVGRAEARARTLGELPGPLFAATKQAVRGPALEAMAAAWP